MKIAVGILKKHCRALLCKQNVVGVGVGYREKKGQRTGEKAIIIFVTQKVASQHLARAELAPRFLQGHRVDVIAVGEVRFMRKSVFSGSLLTEDSRLARWRPAPGGVSVGHYRSTAGTLGCAVRDSLTGKRYLLSNNHVLANASSGKDGRASMGDPVLQPGPYDGGRAENDTIARLERFVPLYSTYQTPVCSTARLWESLTNSILGALRPSYRIHLQRASAEGNLIDAALAGPLDKDELSPGLVGLGGISGTGESYPGDKVTFSGRTSGIVKGTCIAREVSLFVTMEPGRELFFTDQLITSAVSLPGDSGSILLDGKKRAVGLLFAGSEKISVCNRMANVTKILGVEPELGQPQGRLSVPARRL